MNHHLNCFTLILLIFFLHLQVMGQTPGAINDANQDLSVITRNVQVLKTVSPIGLDSVLKPGSMESFEQMPDKSVFFSGWDTLHYWFRFYVRNDDSLPRQLFLLMGPIGHTDARLYQSGSSQWRETGRTGNNYKFEDRPYPHIHSVFPLTIRARSVDTFYLSMDYNGNYKTFAFALADSRKLHYLESRTYFLFGIMIGILILFAILNIYLFFSLKERLHLWYAGYITMLAFMIMKYEGLDEQFFPLDSITANRLTPVMGLGALTICLLIHIVQMFLVNIQKKSLLYRLTSVVKINLLISALTHISVFYWQHPLQYQVFAFEWANKSLLLGIAFILVNCIYSYSQKFKPALFILLGTCVFLIGAMEKIIFVDNDSYLFPPSLFEIGMVLEAAIISFGLMYRYGIFKKEKEQLALNLSHQRSEAAQKIIEAQEAERKRIAEDLHDELGSNLAALKFHIQKSRLEPQEMESILKVVDKASADTRHISHNLMPPEFEKTSLELLLQSHYKSLNAESPVKFNFLQVNHNELFDKVGELMIFRIIMELTNNIIRHSKASEATVQLIYNKDYLEILTEDNGQGMIQKDSPGIGLKNIRSRLEYVNGKISIDTGKNGTTTIIRIPKPSI